MSEETTFGTWLHHQRRILDLTQQTLADQAGCARITLRRIEADVLKPSKELALILLEKIGVPEHERSQWVAFARGLAGFPTKQIISSPSKPITNIPAPITTFVGREKEQVEIINLIHKHRLVTLTGSGGVGKTRLSLKVGGQVLGDYANGVWLAELASISDPTLLTQTIAKVFGLAIQSGIPILEILLNFLRAKTTLLILDNCEHLLDACAQLTDTLLKHCPNLKILATSREPMGITGEALYRVPSLELPDLQHILDHFKDYESVRLFVERAQLAQTDFSLTMEDASFVAQICSHLDGIPLALELAAAKVGSLSTKEIAEQLETSFNLLTGGSRTALPRQQTIRASLEWSWTLLSEEERVLMRQLSVFAGGWTLESAQAVSDGAVVGLMDSLVKKSLIALNQESGSERRYRFHEMIRQYAREKLVEAGEEENIRMRHLAYFVKLAQQAEPELYRANQLYWWEKLSAEFDNIRAALEWAVKSDAKAGLQLMTDSWLFWVARSDRNEANRCLTQLLERHVEVDALRVSALVLHTQMAVSVRDLTQANILASQALELARTLANKDMEAFGLLNMGVIAGFQSDFGRSIPLLEQSLEFSRELGNIFGQALALGALGAFSTDHERGKTYLMESLTLYRVLGHLSGIAFVLKELANLEIWEGDFLQSAQRLEEARSIFHQLGDPSSEASVLQCYGRLAFAQGNYPLARTYYEESIVLGEMSGDYLDTQWTHANLAYATLKEGDVAQARRHFEISIQSFQEINNSIGVTFAIEGLASLHCNQNQPEHASRLIGWADATREKIGDLRPRGEQADVDRDIAAIIAKIGSSAFEVAYDEGRAMTLDEAVAYALEES